jgi:UDP-2,3-diacylglucosamine hydrolase
VQKPISCFISDIHFSPSHPKTARFFLEWLKDPFTLTGERFSSLFILGDLFDFWVGDDGLDTLAARPALEAIEALHHQQVSVYFLAGNRDFLLSRQLLSTYHITLLDQPYALNQVVLCMHGDQLCTDDQTYMQWYQTCRQPSWQQAFLAQPLQTRLSLANQAREQSSAQNRIPQDVHVATLDKMVSQTPLVSCVIHGHTHQPATHQHNWGKRLVLPDWDLDTDPPRYGWALVSESSQRLYHFS